MTSLLEHIAHDAALLVGEAAAFAVIVAGLVRLYRKGNR